MPGPVGYKPDLSALKKRAKEAETRQKSRGGAQFFRLPEGRTVIRLMPPWSKKAAKRGIVVKEAYKHAFKIDNKWNMPVCGRQTDPDEHDVCPICDFIDNNADKMDTDSIRARFQGYVNAVVRGGGENGSDELKIVQLPRRVADTIIRAMADPDSGGDITDPVKGHDVIIERSGTGLDTEYTCNIKVKSTKSSGKKKEREKWLAGLGDLDKIFKIDRKDLKEQKKLVKGIATSLAALSSEGGDDDDDVELPSRKVMRGIAKKGKVKYDKSDDEEDIFDAIKDSVDDEEFKWKFLDKKQKKTLKELGVTK